MSPSYRVRYRLRSKTFVLSTYGYIQRKPKGPSLRESNRDESEDDLYIQGPDNLLAQENGRDPVVSIKLTTLVERDDEEEGGEIFANKAADDLENNTSLSADIVRELGDGQETQFFKMNFDEPGEETKL